MSSLFSGRGEKKRLLSTTLVLPSISSALILGSICLVFSPTHPSLITANPLSPFGAREVRACACVWGASSHPRQLVLRSTHCMESFGRTLAQHGVRGGSVGSPESVHFSGVAALGRVVKNGYPVGVLLS